MVECPFNNNHNICRDYLWFHVLSCFSPFQVCLTLGTLIMLAGLIALLVGYATPARIEAFGADDLLFVDR